MHTSALFVFITLLLPKVKASQTSLLSSQRFEIPDNKKEKKPQIESKEHAQNILCRKYIDYFPSHTCDAQTPAKYGPNYRTYWLKLGATYNTLYVIKKTQSTELEISLLESAVYSPFVRNSMRNILVMMESEDEILFLCEQVYYYKIDSMVRKTFLKNKKVFLDFMIRLSEVVNEIHAKGLVLGNINKDSIYVVEETNQPFIPFFEGLSRSNEKKQNINLDKINQKN